MGQPIITHLLKQPNESDVLDPEGRHLGGTAFELDDFIVGATDPGLPLNQEAGLALRRESQPPAGLAVNLLAPLQLELVIGGRDGAGFLNA